MFFLPLLCLAFGVTKWKALLLPPAVVPWWWCPLTVTFMAAVVPPWWRWWWWSCCANLSNLGGCGGGRATTAAAIAWDGAGEPLLRDIAVVTTWTMVPVVQADDEDDDGEDEDNEHALTWTADDGGVLLTDTLKSIGADTVISIMQLQAVMATTR